MKIGMYQAVPNFGDVLNEHLWWPYFGPLLEREDNILMLGIGTLIGGPIRHEGPVIVCGSGCGYGDDFSRVKSEACKIFFVRGPMSAKLLGLTDKDFITDPAILTPDIFEAAPKTDKIVFVPHWESSLNPLWQRACKLANIEYVDPLSDIRNVMAKISGAKLVIAEAMHAAIIADSYRVPWVSVASSPRINDFKWQDWAVSLNMAHAFRYITPLGLSGILQNRGTGRANIFTGKKSDRVSKPNPFTAFKAKLRKILTPLAIQLDAILVKLAPDQFFAKTASELRACADLPAQLSDNAVFHQKKQDVIERLAEARQWLENAPSSGK